jgi:hypothetical protein
MGTPSKKGLGWKEAQRQGDFTNNFMIYTCTGFTHHIYGYWYVHTHNTGEYLPSGVLAPPLGGTQWTSQGDSEKEN